GETNNKITNKKRKSMKTSNRITKSVLVGAATLAAVALVPALEGAVPTMNIETVAISGANVNDTTGYGEVTYDYHIGKYEVTQEQWKDFLNEVAKTDSHGLYNTSMTNTDYSGITRTGSSGSYSYHVDSNYAKRPVVCVSLLSAKRFCNWLTTGDTELGLYDMGVVHDNDERDTATWLANGGVVLPDENEWYKAAYYDPNKNGAGVGGYHTYSTTGSVLTNGGRSDTMDGTRANYDISYQINVGGTCLLNPVDFYETYASAYGAVDMTGNVFEWTDSPYNTTNRVVRGASCSDYATLLAADSSRAGYSPGYEYDFIGFRVASLAPIPEPAEIGVIGGALVGLLCIVRRKRRAVAP
ncbi:MAG: formylglycine-generating enzyme family protein, partial [Puniceicoccales bacterium]|nr:formylglycine-generating enzyme family protein [Puniceicoccales bacterium]